MTRTQAIKYLKAIVYVGMYGGLLLPLVFVPKVIFPFVFSKLLYFQMLIGLTFPAYLVLAWIEPKYRPRWHALYLAIAAYFFAVFLSFVFAVDPVRSWWGNQERMNGLFTLLHFFAWLTMMTSLLRTWEQWKKILLFEVGISVAMGIVALLQKPFPRLLIFPAGVRVGGLLDNPIYMAAYQIFNLFFIALLWLKGVSKSTKMWLVIAIVIDIAAFAAAQSRGALVGLAAGIIVFSIVFAILTPNKKAKITVLSALAFCFLSYGVLFAMKDTDIVKNLGLSRFTDIHATTRTRFIAWEIAWKGFLERPLTGWGFDDFHIVFNAKYNPESLRFGYYETWFDRAHNTVMDTLAMTGLFGFFTFFGIFGALFYSVYRAYKKRWIDVPVASVLFALPVAYFIQNLFVFDQPAGFTMSFFLYAFVIGATSGQFVGDMTEQKETTAVAGHKEVPWMTFAILQFIFLLIVWRTSVLPGKASYYSILSNNYFSAGMLPQAFEAAKTAASISTPYLDEQTFLQSRNLISIVENGSYEKFPDWRAWHDLVKDITERHLASHMQNTHPHFIYARFLHTFSRVIPEDAAAAEREYKKSIETSPTRQQLYYSLARFYIERGQKEEGYKLFKQAADLDPEVGESRWYTGLSLSYDLNRQAEGSKELVAAMKVKSPYQPKEVREAVAIAIAYADEKDVEGMKALIITLPNLPGGQIPYYLEIARAVERLGMIEERNLLLGAITKIEPRLVPRFEPLTKGSATSIEDSFKQTMYLEAVSSTAPAATPASTGTLSVPAAGASAGPRR